MEDIQSTLAALGLELNPTQLVTVLGTAAAAVAFATFSLCRENKPSSSKNKKKKKKPASKKSGGEKKKAPQQAAAPTPPAKKNKKKKKGGAEQQQQKKKPQPKKKGKKKEDESGDDWSSDDGEDDLRMIQKGGPRGVSAFPKKKEKKQEQSHNNEGLSKSQRKRKADAAKKAGAKLNQQQESRQNKETGRQLMQRGAISASLTSISKADSKGFEVVKKKERKKKVPAAISYGEDEPAAKKDNRMMEAGHSSVEVEIDPRHYGLLIGEKGATLIKLQDDTGARVDVPKRDSGKKTITISGPPQSIVSCQALMKNLINGGSAVSEINCPPEKIGIVIGPGGKNVKAIQAQLSVRVNLPERGGNSNKIVITGEKAGVKQAKDVIKSLIANGFSALTDPGVELKEIDIDPDNYKFIIGAAGQTIKSIQGDTKCKVNIPRGVGRVSVVGPAAGVARAIVQIQKCIERAQAMDAERNVSSSAASSGNTYALDENDPNYEAPEDTINYDEDEW
jgi:rRNA processing protein Krr1/Pno1